MEFTPALGFQLVTVEFPVDCLRSGSNFPLLFLSFLLYLSVIFIIYIQYRTDRILFYEIHKREITRSVHMSIGKHQNDIQTLKPCDYLKLFYLALGLLHSQPAWFLRLILLILVSSVPSSGSDHSSVPRI